ncbi:hypothetical protein DBV15_02641 [Temnothorax longispinosus]|uniref:Uncharacterized protein n=1 Tax=Temnothorax longispinosus TaxID=300112 RepID=A0A4S2K8W0_9HYME|nr:hypothetical protein DBV15_02641 [Temnothorax longispinosus]
MSENDRSLKFLQYSYATTAARGGGNKEITPLREEVARSESLVQLPRSLSSPLIISETRIHILRKSRGEFLAVVTKREKGRRKTISGGVGVPWKKTEMRRTDGGRRMDSKGLATREKGDREEDRGGKAPRLCLPPPITPRRPAEITEDTEAPWDWRATGLFLLSSLTDTKARI